MPPKHSSAPQQCGNIKCRTTQTPLWRKGWKKEGEEGKNGRGAWVMLCNSCGLHYKKGHFCYHCNQIYREKDADDHEEPWIACERCHRWLHLNCEKSRNTSFEQNQLEDGGNFFCSDCRALRNSLNNDQDLFAQTFPDVKKRRRKPQTPASPSPDSPSSASSCSSQKKKAVHKAKRNLPALKLPGASQRRSASCPTPRGNDDQDMLDSFSERPSYEILSLNISRLPISPSTPTSANSPGMFVSASSFHSDDDDMPKKLMSPKKKIMAKTSKMKALSPSQLRININEKPDLEIVKGMYESKWSPTRKVSSLAKLGVLWAVCEYELQRL